MGTYYENLQAARDYLKSKGIADADTDAWYLMAHVLKINRSEFFLRREEQLLEDKAFYYHSLVEQRAGHIPLQHITGSQEFMGLDFEVNEHVLIPRQDTEILVEEAGKVCSGKSVLDLCTGSGCIIISLAKLYPISKAAAVDISEKALETAGRNAVRHGVEIEFILSDLYERVEGVYDIIVSNPPYIPKNEINNLMPEVKDHEPYIALEGGEDGLDFYRRIIQGLKRHLSDQGRVFFEIGCDQAEAVSQLLALEGFAKIQVKKDLSGLNRVVSAQRP
jgi:release factor glutamine methyltransferase